MMMYHGVMNDVLSNAEITAELAAEANPLPDALRCVTPSREREVVESIKLAMAMSILYGDECCREVDREEEEKATKKGVSRERFLQLQVLASKEFRDEQRGSEETCECQRCGEQWDASTFAKGEVVDGKVDECGECWREEMGDPRDEYTYLGSDWRG